MKKINEQHGITLVALVITIIILLILAGVAISALTQTGLFENAKQAKNAMENAQNTQNEILTDYSNKIDEYIPNSNDNKIYTITFEANGASGTMEKQEHHNEKIKLSKNQFTNEGNYFVNWNTKADGTGEEYYNEEEVSFDKNMTLYAIWEKIEDYSILTSNGMVVSNNLNKNALPKEAYDGNLNTYFSVLRENNRYIKVDKSTYNKKLKIDAFVEDVCSMVVYFYNDNSIISGCLFYTAGKDTSEWKYPQKQLIKDNVVTSFEIIIPEGTKKIGLQKWHTGAISRVYNISVE